MKIDTAPALEETVEVGDYITLTDGPSALTWEVLSINSDPGVSASGALVVLRSGQSSRRLYTTLDHLTLHTKGATE